MSEADRRLSEESEQRFLDLYAHLLVYVNDRFDVIEEIETVADLEQHYTDELLPLRNTLYNESTTDLIEDFVDQNPADLSEADLEQVAAWTDFITGEFVVVRYREDDAIFLDWTEPPKAYAVRPARLPFVEVWDESALPVPVSSVVLLPFEDQIVYDGWIGVKNIIFGGSLSTDIDDGYEEAKHRFGIIDSFPVPEEAEKTDAEELRFYMKNKRNRERYASEIEQLREKTDELEQIYHQEMGKARARSLGRELRELGLNEAYVAIYDDRIITSAPSESEVRELLEEIMPAGKAEYPYIYHFDP
ncbi:hypothetical protein PM033_11875 [Halorubrum ezzemoulense]|uniref:hypothetical protein n=1 Tax=Halorubrum ezzemoulense TaxID=337243 RepID=UPI00232C9956|nr:hypothetical protein [Halorubrum ezzemoulense]MDB2252471.1 hypothetical protein [Halorubrum ezzemoulense]MDB2275736.1 hypothetical protein [Halorubrum ezzemoulense]